MTKRVIVSWSSGKDSALSLFKLLDDPGFEVVALFTTYYQDYIPFQATPLIALQKQLEAIGLPSIQLELPKIFPDNNIYQSLVIDALKQSDINFDAMAFGDMFCNGIAEYRKSYIEPAGWECIFPLIGSNSKDLAIEIIEKKISTFICTVDTQQLDGKFVGRDFNQQLLNMLPDNIDPCGEDGEFHTFVTNAPFFNFSINVDKTEVNREGRFHFQKYRVC